MLTNFRRRRAGFTLIELIVVILILGILAGIAVVAFTSITDKAKVTAAQTEMRELSTATLAQATLAGTTTLTRDMVKAALVQNFGATVTVVDGASAAANDWTLLPPDQTPTGPHQITVVFTDSSGTHSYLSGTTMTLFTAGGPGIFTVSSVGPAAGASTCPDTVTGQVLTNDGGPGFYLTKTGCLTYSPDVSSDVCGAASSGDSAYWVGYDTATFDATNGRPYDTTLPSYFSYPLSCEADYDRGYAASYYLPRIKVGS